MAQSLRGYAHLPQWVMCSRTYVNKSIMYRKGLEMWTEWLRNFLPDSGNNARFYARKNIWTTVFGNHVNINK